MHYRLSIWSNSTMMALNGCFTWVWVEVSLRLSLFAPLTTGIYLESRRKLIGGEGTLNLTAVRTEELVLLKLDQWLWWAGRPETEKALPETNYWCSLHLWHIESHKREFRNWLQRGAHSFKTGGLCQSVFSHIQITLTVTDELELNKPEWCLRMLIISEWLWTHQSKRVKFCQFTVIHNLFPTLSLY